MTDKTVRHELSRGQTMRVDLPDSIGFVEIRTTGVHGPTGYPVIGVDVVSKRDNIPADDGLLYSPARDRDCGVVLIGRPTAQTLEKERFAERMRQVIEAHDSGEHAFCPDTCPALVTGEED